jgi:microcystin-dependent protein
MHLPAILPAAHIQPVANTVPYINQPALEWADLNQWPDAETAFPAAYEQDWDSSFENQETFEDFLAKKNLDGTNYRRFGPKSESFVEGPNRKLLNSVPSGAIIPWPTRNVPSGYVLCDGRAISRTSFPNLFNFIGTTFGSGNGRTTFNVPDLRARTAVGRTPAAPNDTPSEREVGQTGGAQTVTLELGQMAEHDHAGSTSSTGQHTHDTDIFNNGYFNRFALIAGSDNDRVMGSAWIGSSGTHKHTASVGAVGGAGAHNNMQPFMALNYIIKT